MKKQMISFPDPQHDYIVKRSKKMGISRAELVRMIISRHIDAVENLGTLPDCLSPLRINGQIFNTKTINARMERSPLNSLELDIDMIPDPSFKDLPKHPIAQWFLKQSGVFVTLGEYPDVIAGMFLFNGMESDLKGRCRLGLFSSGPVLGLLW